MSVPRKNLELRSPKRGFDHVSGPMRLRFRPHHFLCALGFQGKGYSPSFISNFSKIVQALNNKEGDQVVIEVVAETDSICEPCPNRRDTKCTTEEKIRLLDQRHQKLLGIEVGQNLQWGQAKDLMASRVEIESFRDACKTCSWLALGVCEKALLRLKNQLQQKSGACVFIFATWMVFSGGPLAWGKPQATSRAMRERHPAQVVRPALNLKKDPNARELRALGAPGRWGSVDSSGLYYDHAQALLAIRAQSEAEKSVLKRQWVKAEKKAQEARRYWLAIVEHCSSSPWNKKIPEQMGKVDLIFAQVHFAKKRFKQARESFERAWDRLPFSVLSTSQISNYFESCQKKSPDFWIATEDNPCAAWARRLVLAFVKQSPERAELAQKWKPLVDYVVENPGSVAAPRVQQAYRQGDEDVTAWEAIVPLLRDRRLRQIRQPLRDFLEKFPRSALRQKARYWLGASQIEDGEIPEDIRPLFETIARESPLSFYGLLAAQQLGKTPEDFLVTDAPESKGFDLRLHPTEMVALRKAEALLNANDPNLVELAQMELRELRPKETLDTEFLVHLANLNNRAASHLGAFSAVTELIQRGARAASTSWAAKIVFPVERWPLILENAKRNNIDPVWVLALMKQESAFDLGAISSSGAVGLMQLMPATAVDTDPKIRRVELGQDANNVRIGTLYMAEMFRRFKGNIALATAAYNAGPAAVEKWMKEFNLKDGDDGLSLGLVEFIESIPFKETRDYVGSIIRNYYWYSRRLPLETRNLPQTFSGPQPLGYFWARNLNAGGSKAAESNSK
ncbi:MAG: DUF1284 domain-containing protein [Bdellovibrionales bacterium]|nr:DUF1284 domain-containing protein [Bdellovibrionales bacterium]